MDRMAQTALNSMKNLMENQMATAHNYQILALLVSDKMLSPILVHCI